MPAQPRFVKRSLRHPNNAFVVTRRIIRTDQPGRLVAVGIVSPLLMYKGVMYEDVFIQGFSLVLFVWDLYWIITKPPIVRGVNNSS